MVWWTIRSGQAARGITAPVHSPGSTHHFGAVHHPRLHVGCAGRVGRPLEARAVGHKLPMAVAVPCAACNAGGSTAALLLPALRRALPPPWRGMKPGRGITIAAGQAAAVEAAAAARWKGAVAGAAATAAARCGQDCCQPVRAARGCTPSQRPQQASGDHDADTNTRRVKTCVHNRAIAQPARLPPDHRDRWDARSERLGFGAATS